MKLRRFNGNNQPYTMKNIKIVINGFMNETALNWIKKNTGLNFAKHPTWDIYEAIPKSGHQVLKLLVTYNFQTKFYDNIDTKETLVLSHYKGA